MAFLCRMEDAGDLTDQVIDAVTARPVVVAETAARGQTPTSWRVIVTCSKGHPNLFEGRGVPTADTQFDILGRTPSSVDEALIKASTSLSPVESLARLDMAAKYFIGLVSTIGVLTTAFGMLASPPAAPAALLAIPAALAALSIVAALGGIFPKRAEVRLNNIVDLTAHFDRLIVWRGRWVLASGILLALAVASAPLVRILAERTARNPPPSGSRLTLTALLANQIRTITLKGDVAGAEPYGRVIVEVRGFAGDDSKWEVGRVVAATSTRADAKGAAQVAMESQLPAGVAYTSFRAQTMSPIDEESDARVSLPTIPTPDLGLTPK